MSHVGRLRPWAVASALLLGIWSGSGFAQPEDSSSWRRIRVDLNAVPSIERAFSWQTVARDAVSAEYWLTLSQVEELATFLHEERGHCGGFKDVSPDIAGGEIDFLPLPFAPLPPRKNFGWKTEHLDTLFDAISEENVRSTIAQLSSLPTRKYNSDEAVKAAHWVKTQIEGWAQGRADVSVRLFEHSWKMPSVIARVEGSESPQRTVIIGAHLDSINKYFWKTSAPGADDDASGVAAAMEAFRVLLSSGERPRASVEFIAYSAEEMGLWGSQAIANKYRKEGRDVIGVMQLDMTAYPGPDRKVYFVSDFVNSVLTDTVRSVAERELGFETAFTRCNYACSDHASWTDVGYPSVFPFEADDPDSNPNIHTANDTLENGLVMEHAVKFAKLGLAYLLKLAF